MKTITLATFGLQYHDMLARIGQMVWGSVVPPKYTVWMPPGVDVYAMPFTALGTHIGDSIVFVPIDGSEDTKRLNTFGVVRILNHVVWEQVRGEFPGNVIITHKPKWFLQKTHNHSARVL